MTTVVTEFANVDAQTGAVLYPGHETVVSGTATVNIRSTTRAISITTDSASLNVNLGSRAALAADLAPPTRGYFEMRLAPQNATRNQVLNLINA